MSTGKDGSALNDRLIRWRLSEPALLAHTFTGEVYKVRRADRGPAVLKVPNAVGRAFEGHAAAYLDYAKGPCVRVYEADAGAVLLEYAVGPELKALVDRGEDDAASLIAARTIAALHAGQADPIPGAFPSMAANAAALFAAADDAHPCVPRAKALFRELIATTRATDVRALHRDVHHMNILESARGWVVIDPQPVTGDRHYECATLFLNPDAQIALDPDRRDRMAAIFCRVLDLDPERLRRFAFCHAALSACWSMQDGQDPRLAFAFAEMAGDAFG